MHTRRAIIMWAIAVPFALALATTGCATKKYVRQQVDPVSARLNQHEAQAAEQMAALSDREHSDVSRLSERITTTDQHVAQVEATANQAQGTASRAMTQADANSVATAMDEETARLRK